MDYVRLGSAGMKVSRICLGCMTYGSPEWRPWVLDEEASRPLIRHALELGINFLDTADFYGQGASELVVGKALKDFARRDEVVLATKVRMAMSDDPNARGLSRKHIMQSIDASLKRLGTDYVDLYQIHRWDYDTPVEETLDALNDVVRAGKALYIGASSMWAWQFMKALGIQEHEGYARFVSMQNHYNLIYREEEREMLPLCREEGIGVLPWSPMARGRLTRPAGAEETTRATTDDVADMIYGAAHDEPVAARVREAAERLGEPPARVALAWLLRKSDIAAPIVGASKPGHLEDAVAALGVELDEETVTALEEPYRTVPVAGHE